MGQQRVEGLKRKLEVLLTGHLLRELLHHPWDVFLPLSQRRNVERHDAKSEEEILAELPLLHLELQVLLGRRDDANIDADGAAATHPTDLTLLQNAQQLGLQIEGELAELVQKDRPAVSQLEGPLSGGGRSGVGALLMPKELGLDQGPRHGAAVHHDEGAVLALAQLVDRAGHQVLAGAGLSLDMDRGLGG